MLSATSEPKATARTTTATRMPIFSLLGSGVSLGVAETAVVLDLDTCVDGVLGCLLGVLELLDTDLVLGERDRGERGLAVLTEGRSARVVGAADIHDPVAVGQLGHGLLDGGLDGRIGQTLVGVEDARWTCRGSLAGSGPRRRQQRAATPHRGC